MKYLYFLLIVIAGFILIRYCRWIVVNFGIRSASAEKFFGPGGTYTAVKILGVFAIAMAFYYLVKM